MRKLDESGLYPLSQRHIDDYIPAAPGAYSLSIRLASGVHYSFHSGETGDLQFTLRLILGGTHSDLTYSVRQYLERFQCYLAYCLFPAPEHSGEIEKLIRETNDPVVRLRVIRSN